MCGTHALGDHKRDLLVIKAIHDAGVFTLVDKRKEAGGIHLKPQCHGPDLPVHDPTHSPSYVCCHVMSFTCLFVVV